MLFKRSLRIGWLEILLGVCGVSLLVQILWPTLIPGWFGSLGQRLSFLAEFANLPWWGWTVFSALMTGVLVMLRVFRAVAENRDDPVERVASRREDERLDALQRATLSRFERTSSVNDDDSSSGSATSTASAVKKHGALGDENPPADEDDVDSLHGGEAIARGEYDYAAQVLKQAVLGDLDNPVYLENLLRHFRSQRRGKRPDGAASLKAHAARAALKQAIDQDDWPAVIDAVCVLLKLDPGDMKTLVVLAASHEKRGAAPCRLSCLVAAFQADQENLEILRPLGHVLAQSGQYDKALACWRRVEKLAPDDDQARHMIVELTELRRKASQAQGASSSVASVPGEDEEDQRHGSRHEPAAPKNKVDLKAAAAFVRRDFGVATEVLIQCVVREPKNIIYLQNLLRSLQAHRGRKERRRPQDLALSQAARAALQAAVEQNHWKRAVDAACELLHRDPDDALALVMLAAGHEEQGADECQLHCYKTALESDTSNVDVLRPYGRALERLGHLDQALGCWRRVEKALPGDEEASRKIAELSGRKNLSHGEAPQGAAGAPETDESPAAAKTMTAKTNSPRESELLLAIRDAPAEYAHYNDLAGLYVQNELFEEAQIILEQGLKAAGDSLVLRECLEDVQLMAGRRKVELARQKATERGTGKALDLAEKIQAAQNLRELEIFAARVQRTPGQVVHRFEWGQRLMRAGRYQEAIAALQAARGDIRHKGRIELALGDCFRAVGKDRLALANYQAAVAQAQERDDETKKEAHYQVGELAVELGELDLAERHLTVLAEMDFSYRDVASKLEAIARTRRNP
jgi:tetratricopeptide (TPR) repeat protein